jgi:acetate kinase
MIVALGSIGENVALVREQVCSGLSFLGLKLDSARNTSSTADTEISTADSTIRVPLVHTQEDWEIARESWLLTQ